uniref:(California timema) hypothetical protein n=1 Tax=Timema californicum TaxID=61474 RepID=A0A7R9JMG2_TIMCA|nr:unnamed protein product [Timema californicum]
MTVSRYGATTDRKRGLQRHALSANDRATILGEAPQPDDEKRLAEAAARLTEGLEKTVSSGQFKPFLAQPDKQRRYEHFLVLGGSGQKDGLSRLQPVNMTDWERERERGEFEQAARLYKPLSAAMSERFVSATHPDSTDPLVEVEKTTSLEDADLRAAARLKMFGRLTRIKTEWQPCSLLCKRFNIPEPSTTSGGSPPRTQRKSTNFAVFDFLATTPPRDQDTDVSGALQESSRTSSGPSVTSLNADTVHSDPVLEETPEDTSQVDNCCCI